MWMEIADWLDNKVKGEIMAWEFVPIIVSKPRCA